MTNVYRSGLAAVVVSLVLAGAASAQPRPSELLNALDVRLLAASPAPADQLRLAAHFEALAVQYTKEATRHASMAGTFVGTSGPQLNASMAVHCRQLIQQARESAATLHELAAYHAQLGRGLAPESPANGARFYTGEGATPPTPTDVRLRVDSAKTPIDHRVLAEYFSELAVASAKSEATHAHMANTYRGTKIESNAVHCDRLVTAAHHEGDAARAAAALHTRLSEVN